MKDDFIYKALPEVRREFAHALYAKISTEASASSHRSLISRLQGLRRSHIALISLGIFLLVAWSQIRFLVRYVPVGDFWLIEYELKTQTSPGKPVATPIVPSPKPPQEYYFFAYITPSWIPKGFEVEHPSEKFYWRLLRIWSNDAGQEIRLSVSDGTYPYAPLGMWKEVRINNKPAVLIYGRLALTSPDNPRASRKWDETLGLQLYWTFGENIYSLETDGPYVSEQDLIRMAESVEGEPVEPFFPIPLFTPTP